MIQTSLWPALWLIANSVFCSGLLAKDSQPSIDVVLSSQPNLVHPLLASSSDDRFVMSLLNPPLFESRNDEIICEGCSPQSPFSESHGSFVLTPKLRWADGRRIRARDLVLSWDLLTEILQERQYNYLTNSMVLSVNKSDPFRVDYKLQLACYRRIITNLSPIPAHLEGPIKTKHKQVSDYLKASLYNRKPQTEGLYQHGAKVLRAGSNSLVVERGAIFRLRKGNLDTALNLPNHLIADHVKLESKLIASRQLLGVQGPSSHLVTLAFQTRHPDLRNFRFRMRLAQALNRSRIALQYGIDDPATSLVIGRTSPPPAVMDDTKTELLPRKELSIDLTYPDILQLAAEKVREDWEKIGVAVSLKPVKPKVFRERVVGKGKCMMVCLVTWDLPEAADYYEMLHSSQIPAVARNYGGYNVMSWHSQRVDQLIEMIRGKWLSTEQYQQAVNEIDDLVRQQAVLIPLFFKQKVAWHPPQLREFQLFRFVPSSAGAGNWQFSPDILSGA